MNYNNIPTTDGCPQVIVLQGSTREMGKQYGKKFAKQLETHAVIIRASVLGTPFMTSMYGYEVATSEMADKDMEVMMYVADTYVPEYRAWLEGVQEGCKEAGVDISFRDLVMAATYPCERWGRPGGAYPEGFEGSSTGTASQPYCNGFAVGKEAAKDGNTIVGVSGSPSDETVDRVIVLAYHEDGSFYTTFGTIPNPFGQSAMNGKGFAFAMTSNTSPTEAGWGIGAELAAFYIAHCSDSLEDSIEWLKKVPRSFAAGNFVFNDTEGNICVLETNSELWNLRKPGDAGEEGDYVVSTNHFAAKETIDKNVPEMEGWIGDSKYRLATMSKYLAKGVEQGGIDMDYVRYFLRQDDWYDYENDEWHINEPNSGKGSNVLEYTHSIFFTPGDMSAYYMQGTGSGIGVPAGSFGEFIKITMFDDMNSLAEMMQMDTFFMTYSVARGEYLRVRNMSKALQQDYASQEALKNLLDEAYRNYERGVNRWAYAYVAKNDSNDDEAYREYLADAIRLFGMSQLYSKKCIAQLQYYVD